MATNNYEDLIAQGVIAKEDKPALHLGCGEQHINGYVNIDFPRENRPLHTGSAADYYYDITKLSFPKNSISKIENHHVFEHFPRPVSMALLCAWHTWLLPKGKLIIETPDFDQGIRRYLNSNSFAERQIIIRHLFGSHEENWAVHWDGWYKDKFVQILTSLGFEIQSTRCFSWLSLDNIEIIASKEKEYNIVELREKAKELLKLSKVDNFTSEDKMWEKWCNDFDAALELMTQQIDANTYE
jgi:predicted SAM-dependent methyltransferase